LRIEYSTERAKSATYLQDGFPYPHLIIDDSITQLQECKTIEESRKDMQEDFARDVRHVPVVASECPLEQLHSLSPIRSSICARPVDILCNGFALAFLLDLGNFFAELLAFFAFVPNLGPIFVPSLADDVDRPFTVGRRMISDCKVQGLD
jgi:hypothetical protein